MGLTGKERGWMDLCFKLHDLFCDCKDRPSHLTRCLMDITDEEEEATAALIAFGIEDAGPPAGSATGPGDSAGPSTAG
ncbi:ORF2 [torque teno Delphinidae virus 7]